MAILWDSTHF